MLHHSLTGLEAVYRSFGLSKKEAQERLKDDNDLVEITRSKGLEPLRITFSGHEGEAYASITIGTYKDLLIQDILKTVLSIWDPDQQCYGEWIQPLKSTQEKYKIYQITFTIS